MDDLGGRREGVHLSRDPIVEARPHRHQAVRVMDGHVGVVRPVHAQHVEGQRMRHGEGAQAHESLRHRDLGQLGQRVELGRAVGRDDAASHVEDGALGSHDGPRRLLDLAGMALVGRVVGAKMDLVGIVEGPLLDENVLGQVHVHGTGPSRGRDVKRLLDGHGQIVAVLDEEVVLGRRARDPDIVRFLERVVADQVRRHLAGEGNERDGVHEGVLERRHQVGRGRPRGDEAYSRLARGAGIALGGMTRRRLLANEDVADPFEVVQHVVDRQHGPSGEAEDEIHTLTLQRLEQDTRA